MFYSIQLTNGQEGRTEQDRQKTYKDNQHEPLHMIYVDCKKNRIRFNNSALTSSGIFDRP